MKRYRYIRLLFTILLASPLIGCSTFEQATDAPEVPNPDTESSLFAWFADELDGDADNYSDAHEEHEESFERGEDFDHENPSMDQFHEADREAYEEAGFRLVDPNTEFISPHMAATMLVAQEMATNASVASGRWSDPATWQNGDVPMDGARVIITEGTTVIIDAVLPETIQTVGIMGTLRFAPNVDTQLNVDTIVSLETGHLELGTEDDPINPNVTATLVFADTGSIDRSADPQQLGRGAVFMGSTVMYGTEKTAWSVLATTLTGGETELTLTEAPIGWQVGDQLVVAGTDPNDLESEEVVTITDIDGTTVGFTPALARSHAPIQPGLDVHVANLTRNILFTSENPEIARRGHIMFMHTLAADINYASFTQLGRTDKRIPLDDYLFPGLDDSPALVGPGDNIRGRYSIHFHRGGTEFGSQPAIVNGSVVVDDPGWAYVNHSANVDFISNVSYRIVGGAYQTEAGDEIGSFIGNIAIHTINPDYPLLSDGDQQIIDIREDRQDFAFQGDAFWLHGGGVSVDGNVVSGASGHAYVYWPEGLTEARPNGSTTRTMFDPVHVPINHLLKLDRDIEVWQVPVVSFDNNTAYGAAKGLEFYYLHATFLDNLVNFVPNQYRAELNSTFENLTFWNMQIHAIGMNYTENLTFRNIEIVGNGNSEIKGIDADHWHMLGTHRFENVNVSGMGIGMEVPTNGQIEIVGGTYANLVDFSIRNPQSDHRYLTFEDISFTENAYFNESDRIHFRMDPDFTLSGTIQTGLEAGGVDKYLLYFLLTDRITLDFGPYDGQVLYYAEQAADFVPITEQNQRIPREILYIPDPFVNLSNQQLTEQYGLSFGGALLPADAQSPPGVAGGYIGSSVPIPTSDVSRLVMNERVNRFNGVDYCMEFGYFEGCEELNDPDFVSCEETNTCDPLFREEDFLDESMEEESFIDRCEEFDECDEFFDEDEF